MLFKGLACFFRAIRSDESNLYTRMLSVSNNIRLVQIDERILSHLTSRQIRNDSHTERHRSCDAIANNKYSWLNFFPFPQEWKFKHCYNLRTADPYDTKFVRRQSRFALSKQSRTWNKRKQAHKKKNKKIWNARMRAHLARLKKRPVPRFTYYTFNVARTFTFEDM